MTTQTLIFGHRGYPAKFAENSLEGFRYAVDHNIDGLEFDVHLTKDSVPVVIHDETVDRTTDGKGEIRTFTFAELRQLHLTNGEAIPSLEELLTTVATSNTQLNLELKTDQIEYENIEKIVLEMISQAPLVKPVIFSSFNLETLKKCQKIDAAQQYCWLTMHKVPDAATFVKKAGLAGLHLHHRQADEVVQRIWTINDTFKIRHLFKQGVAGIITDNFEKAGKIRDKLMTKLNS
ncbi:glycerophosphodiester phosphodiesterase family protein [Liquorilactobacillus satsumensis]|nr:glycerophosphodiester phosphodiesterase family protein [Liquorilactobacillus satsumensis]MCC7666138.1 glycerophosphodiester phosphodiesterase [Liquorilactobacillus satsumensis]MCP9313548.1 glycerophosphodiester phosphodiesterase [Liquorilactobacillus satsumensis]MCP9357405.1 glycerophosphodiester phosphodiesterase [Liquorilactobacillus satsumensis]MCP9360686.1 glycerophosphodiester phosphodiesterase [Liquorilactobacillus satsumensis]MCP9371233.1 glycerophosphodiester phosphodiesterase [Liqu